MLHKRTHTAVLAALLIAMLPVLAGCGALQKGGTSAPTAPAEGGTSAPANGSTPASAPTENPNDPEDKALRDAIDLIYRYADGLMSAKENTPLSTGRFTWDTEKKQDSWRYFNGVMLDAFDRVMGEK